MRFLIYIILLIPVYASAQEMSDKPIEITSDVLEIFQDKQTAIFSGNVVVTQEEVTLKADKIEVFYQKSENNSESEGRVSKIEAQGSVIALYDDNTIMGNKARYDVKTQRINIYDDVTLLRGTNKIKGEGLEYDIKTGNIKIDAKKGQRVKGFFIPRSEEQ